MTEKASKQIDFLWQVHAYQNEYIRFADTKAALTIAWSSALISAIYSANLHQSVNSSNAYMVTAIFAASGVFGGFLLAVAALLPRLQAKRLFWSKKNPPASESSSSLGLIYWGEVLKVSDGSRYLDLVQGLDDAKVVDQLARHIVVLSEIAAAKYRFVNLAIFSMTLGSVLTVIVLLLKA